MKCAAFRHTRLGMNQIKETAGGDGGGMELHDRAGGLGGLREGFTEVYVQYNICDFLSSTDFPQIARLFGGRRAGGRFGCATPIQNRSRHRARLSGPDVLG